MFIFKEEEEVIELISPEPSKLNDILQHDELHVDDVINDEGNLHNDDQGIIIDDVAEEVEGMCIIIGLEIDSSYFEGDFPGIKFTPTLGKEGLRVPEGGRGIKPPIQAHIYYIV